MFGLSKRMLTVIGILVVVVVIFIFQGGKKADSQSSTGQCQVQVNASLLNVRASPVDNAPVVAKLANGNTVAATSTQQNGYRELSDGHWASNQFLKVVTGAC